MSTEKTAISRQALAGYRIGIVGGGQLAKMTAQCALQFGCEVIILERNENSPALALATEYLIGDWDDPANLLKLAEKVDVVGLENEFVDSNALAKLEEAGHRLYPSAKTISLVQDKLIQKQTLQAAGIPMPEFRAVNSCDEIIAAADDLGWPLVLKARRNGYDGKGNATLRSADDVQEGWQKLDGNDGRTLYVEAFCPFVKELAVMITRSEDGEIVSYPVVETIQKDHICHTVFAPAQIEGEIAAKASEFAKQAVTAIDGVGTIGVEMFLTEDNNIYLNEMAPRVHNSGHYTIEACETSQFENHVRALLGWPLGSSKMINDAAVMVNLLGAENGTGYPVGIEEAIKIPGVNVHSYGKTDSRTGRKMGHITTIGAKLDEVQERAEHAAKLIQYGAEK